MTCSEIRAMLPAYVRDEKALLTVRRHLADCPGCSEELARYEQLLETLGALESMTVQSPPLSAAALAGAPFEASRPARVRNHLEHNRRVYLSGLAMGGASAAGAAVWLLRSRHPVSA